MDDEMLTRYSADLKRAYENATVAALHVDLQENFYEQSTQNAFSAAKEFSLDMRPRAIPNYWVALTSRNAVSVMGLYHLQNHSMYRFHASIPYQDEEVVFEKRDEGLFHDPSGTAGDRLRRDGIDTLLVTGIYHDKCFAQTVRGALYEGFRVYAVADATDCPPAQYDFFGREILKYAPREVHGRLSVTSTKVVTRLLPEPATAEKWSVDRYSSRVKIAFGLV